MKRGGSIVNFRVGFGFDVHEFEAGRRLVLGGVEVPHSAGLKGHSDADVVIHAVMDALLGAMALGDIGQHFPDSDSKFKNADSRVLLRQVAGLISENGWDLSNIDITIVAQVPKIQPHSNQMTENIASDLSVPSKQINIKATTTESLGFIGRQEGIATWAVASLIEKD